MIGGSEDGMVYFWDLVDAKVVSKFRAHDLVVNYHTLFFSFVYNFPSIVMIVISIFIRLFCRWQAWVTTPRKIVCWLPRSMVQFVSGKNEEKTMLSGFCLFHVVSLFYYFFIFNLSFYRIAIAGSWRYLLILVVCDKKVFSALMIPKV